MFQTKKLLLNNVIKFQTTLESKSDFYSIYERADDFRKLMVISNTYNTGPVFYKRVGNIITYYAPVGDVLIEPNQPFEFIEKFSIKALYKRDLNNNDNTISNEVIRYSEKNNINICETPYVVLLDLYGDTIFDYYFEIME